ncbi:MAG: hypothetical protein WD688_14355 [Candidatus Binatia bacterium]
MISMASSRQAQEGCNLQPVHRFAAIDLNTQGHKKWSKHACGWRSIHLHCWEEGMSTCRTERRHRRCQHAGIVAVAITFALRPAAIKDDTAHRKIVDSPAQLRVVDLTLESGDTLLSVLRRIDVNPSAARAMIEAIRAFVNPRKIRPGQTLHVNLNPRNGALKGLDYNLSGAEVKAVLTPEGWSAERRETSSLRETRVVRGSVAANFYQSSREAGLTPDQILEIADIFRYEIDFSSGFLRGDKFAIALEEIQYSIYGWPPSPGTNSRGSADGRQQ